MLFIHKIRKNKKKKVLIEKKHVRLLQSCPACPEVQEHLPFTQLPFPEQSFGQDANEKSINYKK